MADGPVKTLCDLPGKKVAINSLLGLGQLFVDANYYNAHCKGDPTNTGWKKIKFVAILFPQMATAMQKGQVDAIWTLEPFYSVVKSQLQTTLLAGSAYRTVPHGPITALDTSVAYLHAHPDVVQKMQLAIMQSNALPGCASRGDPEADREVHHDPEEPHPEPDPAHLRSEGSARSGAEGGQLQRQVRADQEGSAVILV